MLGIESIKFYPCLCIPQLVFMLGVRALSFTHVYAFHISFYARRQSIKFYPCLCIPQLVFMLGVRAVLPIFMHSTLVFMLGVRALSFTHVYAFHISFYARCQH